MKTKHWFGFLIILAALAVPSLAQAQTTRTLIWNYPNKTIANVSTWSQVIKVNGVTVTAPPVCGNVGVNVECSIPLPTLNATTNNVLSVSASLSGEAYETILNYNPAGTANPGGPTQPAGMGIKITVVVTVGTGGSDN